jgi:hypothetical protein
MTDPLAQINKAEQALACASDIVDILVLRSQAKAVEVVAVAQGFGELAQQAKIFQLKAERKAGGWLGENIQHGGNTKSHRVTLNDIDVSRSQSSRWQLMAQVPEDKFHGWLDERVAKGQEVTAGGLRNYARNISGKPLMGRTTSGIYVLNPVGCALIGYGTRCDGPPTGGHIIHKGEVQGNDEARAILAACPPEIMAIQCYQHNVGRFANSPEAKRIQLIQKIYEFGYWHMEEWFEEFHKCFKKIPYPELELERLIS